ncbi:tensin-2 [Rhinophrynus dorsalis]
MGCAGSCALGGQTAGHSRRTMHLIEPTGGERHVFHEKVLKKKRLCAACSEPVVSQGSVCRVCKIISHKKCEGKVLSGCSSPPPADMRRRTAPGPSIQHMGSTKSLNLKQRSSLPRSFSSLDHVIQRSYDLDLTYITERIISVFFPTSLEQQRYRSNLREVASMLRSKHEDKYLLFNLSKKRHDISRLNPKVQDFFWPDCHAPPLDIICSICKAMEAWLNSDPQHVVVLHCKGNQGKTGVVIASYMHYSKVSASVDQALSTLAMRKFCEDKVSVSLHPSQRRYINYFGGLLSGTIKISSDMLSLQCVLLPVIPALQTDGGFCPFLKIYQSMQLVYTSGIYLSLGSATAQKRQLCISLEPALLLKGDIMVKCYHKRCKDHEREVLFRLQFHTCTIHNTHLCFSKDQLDCACTDDRFPEDAVVEFIFSSGNDKSKGREVCRKDPDVSVDYDITDPLVRFDSYENLNVNHEDSLEDLSHTRGPLDGSLYARVKKKSTQLESSNGSPEQHGRLLSVSSDSGHSSAATERLEETPQKSLPTAAEREDLERLLGGFGVQVKHEGEPQYSQVLKHEEVSPQHGNQRQNVEERPQDLQHRVHMEGTNQNMQTKMNGEARPQFSPIWSGLPEDGASQHLPLASSSWEGQRETTCETHWEGQREREAAIMEEEMGQFGELSVFPGRRPLVSRHCSCRLGYAGPNIEGPPNRSYFRTENILDPRGTSGTGVVVPAAHYPGMYGEHERRRLYRSLSEGPQHYPSQAQSPPKRGSLRDTRPYLCQAPPTHEPLVPPLCPCSHCQNSACYPVPNMQPFHRGELPLHMSQPYGQSVQASHDFPHPFQMPQAKMHYGYSTAHGEDALHYNHFTEGGYGHSYPHFLHPSYLPTHCPPNGYGAHSFPSSMSPYSPPGRQSPPSGSVSPVIPSSSARRRMSGDTTSAGSASELPSPEQKHEHCDRVTRLDAPSFQPQKHGEAGCAATSSAAHLHSPGLTQSPSVQSHSPVHVPSPSVQSHSPVHVPSPSVQSTGFTLPHVSTYSANEENKVMPNTSSPSHVTKVAPQLLVMPETKTEITRGQSSFGSVICSPNEAPASPAGRYTVAFGAGYNAQYSPVSKNSVTPQKRSITISLPAVPVNQHGGEAPTSSPLSPMGSQSELLPPSPTPSFPISTAYYTGSPCPPHMQPPRLPEKFHQPAGGDKPEIQRDCNGSSENSRPALSSTDVQQETPLMGNFVQDSSKFWYKPTISREQAIALLRGADAGSFLIRDSNSFRGAYGLALKVSSPPQNIMTQSYKGDPAEQLVRHFLIETGPKGVKIKGSPIEPHFGSLSALVSQHSVTPLSLPCRLRIPCRDLTEQSSEVMVPTNMSTAADLLRQGAACSVLYLGSVDTESLTGPQAISRASNAILTPPRSSATIVHFKVSEQGITLTDSQRKLFFRRHYPVSSVTFCSADPQDRRWTNPDRTTSKVFGFVARKAGTAAENVCHLFAELDPEQPASAIVNFVTKVMLGSQRR